MELTKRSLKAALGVRSDADLARFFDCTRSAVHQWADSDPLPKARQWQVRALRPDLFRKRKSQSKYG
jgi:hypothetical protein